MLPCIRWTRGETVCPVCWKSRRKSGPTMHVNLSLSALLQMTKRRKPGRRKNDVGKVTKLPVQDSWVLLLPPELIFLIFASCSNAMLLALAQTCKAFNTIALQAFFTRGREFSTPTMGRLSSDRTPVEMLDATRIALFVKQLRSVEWSFKAGCECKIGGPQADPACLFLPSASQTSKDIANVASRGILWRTFDEIANLRAIFSRIPDVGYVNLNFMWVDSWLNMVLPWTHPGLKGSVLDPDVWMAFVDLLDKIVDSGCHRLVINNGEQLLKLFPGEDSRDSVLTSTSKWKYLNLQSLSVHSDILLRPPCSEWLLSLLTSSACANSLTRLLIRSQMTSLPSSLLVSLNLPNLVEFEMQAAHTTLPYDQESTFAKFEDISAFLGTHNDSLKVVSLYGAELPPSTPMNSAAVSTFGHKKPILPKLGSFAAHPAYVAWLLDLAVHSQRRLTLWSLTKIEVKSEDCLPLPSIRHQHFDYASFNKALEALVSWQNGYRSWGKYNTRSRTKNKIFVPGRTIDLNLTFVCPHGIPEWFASHLPSAQGQTSPSILTQLTCVRNLAISTVFPATLREEAIDVIPDWLALISNAGFSSNLSGPRRRGRPPKTGFGTPSELRKVELIFLGDFLGDKDQFIDRVAEKCIGVKWVRTGFLRSDPTVNLDEFRARAGMENAEQ